MKRDDEGISGTLKTLVVVALMGLIAVLMVTGGDDAKRQAQREAEARRQTKSSP